MKIFVPLIAALALSGCALVQPEINVRDLNPPENVIGRLGKPLGTRVVIEGVLAEYALLSNPLLVTKVDGQLVKQRVVLSVRDKPQIEHAMLYRLEGFESGAYASYPAWIEPQMQQPFHFYSYFVVTKVIASSGPVVRVAPNTFTVKGR